MVYRQLAGNLQTVLRNHTAGDPMRENVKWTNLSRRQIARKLKELGTPANKDTVSRLLYDLGFRRRKSQKKRTMKQHADRNTQFENIERLKKEYLDAGKPVLSMDTKKKELLGNFYRDGVTDGVEPIIVNDHDFPSYGNGKLIPHGIYDVRKNELNLHLNTSSDTSELACDSLELWWQEQGQVDYQEQDEVLVLCDSGGSNDARSYLFEAGYWICVRTPRNSQLLLVVLPCPVTSDDLLIIIFRKRNWYNTHTSGRWVIEGDLSSYFDTVHHRLLMKGVRKRIRDQRFLNLLWNFIKSGHIDKRLI